MDRILIFALTFLALAAPAAAGEVPILRLQDSGRCTAATGAPGELVTNDGHGVRLLRASATGFTRLELLPLASINTCPTVVDRASGAAVDVALVSSGALRAVVRDPGGGWSQPLDLYPAGDGYAAEATASVSERGDVVVAWWEFTSGSSQLYVSRRAPGGSFGPAEALGAPTRDPYALITGISEDGQAVVLWATADDVTPPLQVPVSIATAPAGTPLGATSLGTIPWRTNPALSVAPDGRALVALPAHGALRLAEREPGGAFGAPVTLSSAVDPFAFQVQLASDRGGRAAVAWTGSSDSSLRIATRAAPGGFEPPGTVDAPQPYRGDPFYASDWIPLHEFPAGAFDSVGGSTQLVLTPDGRAFHTRAFGRLIGGAPTLGVKATTLPLTGGRVTTSVDGGELADARRPFALLLADGRPAVVWTDDDQAAGRLTYRLHLAVDGASAPATPVPAVHVRAPATHVLTRDGMLRFPVRCGGPCFVRAQVVGGRTVEEDALQLTRAGKGELDIDGGGPQAVAPLRAGPVRIRISYGAPDALTLRTRTLTLRLHRPGDPPDPRVAGLRAVRQGDRIRVSWHTDRPTTYTVFWVTGANASGAGAEPLKVRETEGQHGRRAFTVTLTDAAAVHYVSLRTQHVLTGHEPARRELRVP